VNEREIFLVVPNLACVKPVVKVAEFSLAVVGQYGMCAMVTTVQWALKSIEHNTGVIGKISNARSEAYSRI